MSTRQYHRKRARRLDDPRLEYLRNPRARRFLVAAMAVLLAIEAALFVLLDVVGPAAMLGLIPLVAAFVLCFGALKASSRGIDELPEGVLDERQGQLRGRVYVTAYRIFAAVVVVELVAAAVWRIAWWPFPGYGVLFAAALVTFHLALVLPSLVAGARTDP